MEQLLNYNGLSSLTTHLIDYKLEILKTGNHFHFHFVFVYNVLNSE